MVISVYTDLHVPILVSHKVQVVMLAYPMYKDDVGTYLFQLRFQSEGSVYPPHDAWYAAEKRRVVGKHVYGYAIVVGICHGWFTPFVTCVSALIEGDDMHIVAHGLVLCREYVFLIAEPFFVEAVQHGVYDSLHMS